MDEKKLQITVQLRLDRKAHFGEEDATVLHDDEATVLPSDDIEQAVRDAMGFKALDNLDAFFRGESPPNAL